MSKRDKDDGQRCASTLSIEITQSAKEHFKQLLQNEGEGISLRMYVLNPNTKSAGIDIVYCPHNKALPDDLIIEFDSYKLFVEAQSASFLHEAYIDYKINTSTLEGELKIKAPNLLNDKRKIGCEAQDLKGRILFVLENEINPNLKKHKGMVELIDLTPDNKVILKFTGGCQGCSMASVTLKQGIEVTLKNYFPEISEIIDATVHEHGLEPYYS